MPANQKLKVVPKRERSDPGKKTPQSVSGTDALPRVSGILDECRSVTVSLAERATLLNARITGDAFNLPEIDVAACADGEISLHAAVLDMLNQLQQVNALLLRLMEAL